MKRQIELIRTIVAALLIVAAAAVILATVAAAPSTDPPILPTLTAPPHDWEPTPTTQWIPSATPGPYPPPPPLVNTPGPYPQPQPPELYLPYVEGGVGYP